MSRVTDEEKKDFHHLLNISMEKLETPKNVKKSHWNTLSPIVLMKMIKTETCELDTALEIGNPEQIDKELDDIINLALMFKDNLHKGNYKNLV